MMYKFFSSGDNLRLEQKYNHLMKMDITSCFYHIYTHTIAWAVKGKEYAKLNKQGTFETEFDKLIRSANYDETCGILVGPEISRIFAEIILQRIDVNVLNRLKNEPFSLKVGRDYEVRRYVDDHYIYANSKENLQKILEVYKEELQFYKLYINDDKLEFLERPFVSDVLDAKREISSLLSGIADKWLDKDSDGLYTHIVKDEMKAFSFVVNRFRSLSHRYKQRYGTLNRYFLSLLISQIEKELKMEHIPEASPGLLLMYTEIAFYIFSLDMNASASIKLCRIIDLLYRWAEKCSDKTIIPELENRIFREVKRCLDIYDVNRKEGETNLEVMNILLCLYRLLKTPISRNQIIKLFSIANDSDEEYKQLNYFQLCTLMYIIGKDVDYDDVRVKIVTEINRRLAEEDAMLHADKAMLFFDSMVCPYLNKSEKKDILVRLFGYNEQTAYIKLKVYNTTGRWFFNWDKTRSLSELLSKKEYHSPYE